MDKKYDSITEMYTEKKQQELEESFASGLATAAQALGYTGLAGLTGFGAAVLVASGIKNRGKIKNFFKKIFGKKAKDDGIDKLRNKSSVVKELELYRSSEKKKQLDGVLEAIKKEDAFKASEEYRASGLFNDKEAIKIITIAVTEQFGEPPLYYISPGNDTFQFLKRVIGVKAAQNVAASISLALKKNKSYFVTAFNDEAEENEEI